MEIPRPRSGKPKRQRLTPIPQPVSYEVLEQTIHLYRRPDSQLLFAWLYLTGQRVSEALAVKRRHVELLGEGTEKPYLMVDSITEKNPTQPRRKIPIPLAGFERGLAQFVWDAIQSLNPELSLFPFTRQNAYFKLRKASIRCEFIDHHRRRQEGVLSIHPHYLRHCRATHLVERYNYEKGKLERFMGWSSDRMANTYVGVSGQDLAAGMGLVLVG